MRDALNATNRDRPVNSEWDAEEVLLMPAIVSAFEWKTEEAASRRLTFPDVKWTVLETNVSIC